MSLTLTPVSSVPVVEGEEVTEHHVCDALEQSCRRLPTHLSLPLSVAGTAQQECAAVVEGVEHVMPCASFETNPNILGY